MSAILDLMEAGASSVKWKPFGSVAGPLLSSRSVDRRVWLGAGTDVFAKIVINDFSKFVKFVSYEFSKNKIRNLRILRIFQNS